jgi:hypothetical protein
MVDCGRNGLSHRIDGRPCLPLAVGTNGEN